MLSIQLYFKHSFIFYCIPFIFIAPPRIVAPRNIYFVARQSAREQGLSRRYFFVVRVAGLLLILSGYMTFAARLFTTYAALHVASWQSVTEIVVRNRTPYFCS